MESFQNVHTKKNHGSPNINGANKERRRVKERWRKMEVEYRGAIKNIPEEDTLKISIYLTVENINLTDSLT